MLVTAQARFCEIDGRAGGMQSRMLVQVQFLAIWDAGVFCLFSCMRVVLFACLWPVC